MGFTIHGEDGSRLIAQHVHVLLKENREGGRRTSDNKRGERRNERMSRGRKE